jgi:methylmalonyl-CoA mutase C-terminal domain/subunit
MLKDNNLDHVLVIVGGVIPDQDIPKLKDLGVAEVFLPGSPLKDIADYVSSNVGN